MTAAQLEMAAFLTRSLDASTIVDLREIGSEGCVLRTIVPGPLRGPGSWLIGRDGSAQSYEGEREQYPPYWGATATASDYTPATCPQP